MSKINVDEIKVGDLVEMEYCSGKKALGVVSKTVSNEVYGYWSDTERCYEDCELIDNITGHWKVINFEEEDKMDELKVYTGKEALQALLNRKVLKGKKNNNNYRIEKDSFEVDFLKGNGWEHSFISLNNILEFKFTEVATPQVGDWVKVIHNGQTDVGKITKVKNGNVWAHWNGEPNEDGHYLEDKTIKSWQVLSPEQVSEYKREQAFVKVGRKPNEFKESDIAYVEALGVMAVVVSHNNDQEVRLHKINKREGLTAKPHQLTPISFVEQQVDLS